MGVFCVGTFIEWPDLRFFWLRCIQKTGNYSEIQSRPARDLVVLKGRGSYATAKNRFFLGYLKDLRTQPVPHRFVMEI